MADTVPLAEYLRVCRAYHDLNRHYLGDVLDEHTPLHEAPWDECQRPHCLDYRHTISQHGQIPDGRDVTRQR